jgi:hypothetical protein
MKDWIRWPAIFAVIGAGLFAVVFKSVVRTRGSSSMISLSNGEKVQEAALIVVADSYRKCIRNFVGDKKPDSITKPLLLSILVLRHSCGSSCFRISELV